MHEFAHYIHMKKDKKLNNLELIFNTNDKRIEEELISVTNFVDNNSLCTNLLEEKQKTIKNIKSLENSIKEDYPNFSRGQKSKEIEKQIKKSKAKYLLKYDKVKLFRLFGYEILSTETIERDFPSMPNAFINYIKLRSLQRKRSRISARINKLSKYYQNAGELFARFVEGLVKDRQEIERLAPTTYEQFFKLLNTGYYGELKQAFELIRNNTTTLESEILK